ncbi:MAG: ROK family protein [Clostridia bacterium]|nr:ROK family protein [Clostridia bacterium]
MYRIGVDLGGTNIAVGVVDENNAMVGKSNIKTNLPRPAEEIFADVAKACNLALEDAGISIRDVASVGIGAPGTINKETGVIEYANNFSFFNVPARDLMKEYLGDVPIYLDNDANCAALGEAIAGAGHGVKNFIAITLGTGVGSGIVIDGKLVTGINFAAGEMGHTVICLDGERCTCGRRGCWESYSSATALIAQTKDVMRISPDSIMWQIANESVYNVDGRTAFDALRKGDHAAKKVVDKYIYYLAQGITNVVNIFQPDMICIGGGISHEGETLLEPLRRMVARERYSIHAKKQTQIVAAELGNDAGIFGAAFLNA